MLSDAAIDPIIKALRDGNLSLRVKAANALGQLGDKRAVIPLIEALKDEKSGIRAEAAKALGQLGDERAIVPLIESLEAYDLRVRAWAADSLGKLSGTAIVPLSMARRDNHVGATARGAALQAVKRLCGTTVGSLIQALKSDDLTTRAVALKALGKLSDAIVNSLM